MRLYEIAVGDSSDGGVYKVYNYLNGSLFHYFLLTGNLKLTRRDMIWGYDMRILYDTISICFMCNLR